MSRTIFGLPTDVLAASGLVAPGGGGGVGDYVMRTGDTMTGDLKMSSADVVLVGSAAISGAAIPLDGPVTIQDPTPSGDALTVLSSDGKSTWFAVDNATGEAAMTNATVAGSIDVTNNVTCTLCGALKFAAEA